MMIPSLDDLDEVVDGALDDLIASKQVEKFVRQRFGSRSEAGRYAANVRWGNRGADATLPPHLEAIASRAESAAALEPAQKPDIPRAEEGMTMAEFDELEQELRDLGFTDFVPPRPTEDTARTHAEGDWMAKYPRPHDVPAGSRFAGMTPDEASAQHFQRERDWDRYFGNYTGEVAAKLEAPRAALHRSRNGFDRPAQEVSEDEFQTLLASGRFHIVYRGMNDPQRASLLTSRPAMGGGEGGLGTYTAYERWRAQQYGEVTPILIPKTVLVPSKTATGMWGLSKNGSSGFRSGKHIGHGESDNKPTADLMIFNNGIMILGPKGMKVNGQDGKPLATITQEAMYKVVREAETR